MKKSLLLVAIALLSMTMFAQTRNIVLQQSFDGTTVEGWTVAGQGTSNWHLVASSQAGGSPNELVLDWSPQFNGTARFVSPTVDLTGIGSVVVSFKHALDNYSGSHTLGVATSSDGGTTWNVGWSKSYSSSTQYSVCQEITTPDMGQSAVQFCIYYTGNSYNINDWYFDDIEIFTMANLDLGMTAINVADFVGSGSLPIAAKVFNYGSTTATSIEASYQIDNNAPVVQTFDVNMLPLTSTTLNFAVPANLGPGSCDLTINILNVNGTADDDESNNSMSKTISVALGTAQRIPMIEHFSSSSCGPCVSVNTAMNNFCNNNDGRFTYTKYPMNWPGNGDPYYTNEGGTRRTYYGVNAVPQMFLDGKAASAPIQTNAFNNECNVPAFAEIRGAFTVEGNTINVSADIMSYVDLNNATVLITVNEKETRQNIGGNGETLFHHIMMKMLPDANGTTMSIPAGGYQHIEFTQNMSSTNVEEMDDLEVSVWVEDHAAKSIYNSHFLYENIAHPYPATNLILEEAKGDVVATWDAPELGEPTGYDVFLNGELVAENTTTMEYTFPAEYGLFYVVEVQAIYGDGINSVRAVAGIGIGLSVEEDAEVEAFRMYPNPANNRVYVQAESEIQTVSIYNTLGALVQVLNVNSEAVELDLAGYNTGLYLINIKQANGNNATQRLVVAH